MAVMLSPVAELQTKNEAAQAEELKTQQTVEIKAEGQPKSDENKEEESPYKLELDRIKREKSQVNAALHEERARRKQAEAREEALLKSKSSDGASEDKENYPNETLLKLPDEIKELKLAQERLERLLTAKDVEEKISQVTTNKTEAELIKHHLENSVKSSGSLAEDILNAQVLANKHLMFEAGKRAGVEMKREEIMGNLSIARSSGGQRGEVSKIDPETLQVLKILDPSKY